jgi:predicted ATP-grasp superfamily ATP-dependent carboligase/protein-tyrosine-phosphatase
LILGGTPRTVVTISRSLARRGIPVICAGLGRGGLGLRSNSILADIAVATSEPRFFESLKAVLARYDIDTIIPCSDKAIELLLPNYGELTRLAYLTLPKPEIVAQVLQKDQTLKLARLCGVRVPATYTVTAAAQMRNAKDVLTFPMIVKPVRAGPTSPFKIEYLRNRGDLEEFQSRAEANGEYLFQEYFPGEGVGISTVVAEGAPLFFFQHRRLHEYAPQGGVGVLFESETADPELASAAAALLRSLEWRGPAMVEFRRNAAKNDYVLMEINGRFWGSLPLAVYAGVDFPYLQWQIGHQRELCLPKEYKTGLRVRWTSGEISRFADLMTDSAVRERLGYHWTTPIVQLLQSFEPKTRSALFSIHDPLPEFNDVTATVIRVLGSRIWRVVKRLLPAAFVRRASQLRSLEPLYRKSYVARWLLRSSGLRRARSGLEMKPVRRLTIVCRANRIRSPLAAAILEAQVNRDGSSRFQIHSAGTRADPNTTFDPRAKMAAQAMGLTLTGRPQAMTPSLVGSSDVIVVMDRIVEAELLTQLPVAAAKVFLLSEILGSDAGAPDEVRDPDTYSQADFAGFVSQLAQSCRQLAKVLCTS